MESSWYRVKEREGRHRLMRMANDGLLGIKVVETQRRLGTNLGYSSDEIRKFLASARELIDVIQDGISFLRGEAITRSLDPELVLIINSVRRENYLSLDDLDERCETALTILEEAEEGDVKLDRLNIVERLLNDISSASKPKGEMLV